MSITAIPGFSVQKAGRNKYVVSDGENSAVFNKKELKALGEVYGVKEHSTGKTLAVAAGIGALVGAVAAGVVYRKNIGQFLEKSFEKMNLKETAKTVKEKSARIISDGAEKVSKTVDKSGEKATNLKNYTEKKLNGVEGKLKSAKIKKTASAVSGKVQSGARKINETAGKWYNKTADFVVGVFNKIKKFFNGLFGKKSAGQKKASFKQKIGKTSDLFKKINEKVVNIWRKTVDFAGNLFNKPADYGERISAGPIRNQFLKENGEEIIKAFNSDKSQAWLKAFKKRYPDAEITLMPRV